MALTQEKLDDLVLAIAAEETRIAYNCCRLARQNDPDHERISDELVMLQNVLYGLRNYDITSEILTDTEIAYYLELSTLISQSCPS